MKRYLVYELKKSLLPTIIFTAVLTACYLINLLLNGIEYAAAVLSIILMLLCTITPVLNFSFKMSPRNVDRLYSMPIRREKIYFVKALVGLTETLVPFIIAFLLGFFVSVGRWASQNLIFYLPLFFIVVLLTVALFGFNAFVFTRANRVVDGIIFIFFFACPLAVVFACFQRFSGYNFFYWFTYSPLMAVFPFFFSLMRYSYVSGVTDWLYFLPLVVIGAGGWIGLFLTAKREKAEKADGISDAIYGFPICIPFYLAFGLAALGNVSNGLVWILDLIFAVCGLILFALYRHSFRLKWYDWLTFGCAVAVGVPFSFM